MLLGKESVWTWLSGSRTNQPANVPLTIKTTFTILLHHLEASRHLYLCFLHGLNHGGWWCDGEFIISVLDTFTRYVLIFMMSLLNTVIIKLSAAVFPHMWIECAGLTFSLSPLQTVSLRRLNISPGEANREGAGGSGSEDLLLLTFWQKKNTIRTTCMQRIF